MQPALSQVCTLHSSFEQDISDFAAGKCGALDVWLTKLEEHLRHHDLNSVRDLLQEHSMKVPVASLQGGILASQGAAQVAAWELFEQRLAICQELGVTTMVVACDIRPPLRQADIERFRESLAAAAQLAASYAVRLALEFRADAALGNNLQTAVALVHEVGSPYLGICLDAFHYYVGPSQPEDLALLTKQNLFHVQLCDLVDTPREFASDSDRILPGEGDIPLAPIMTRLREIGYSDYVSIELMHPHISQIPPRQFGEIAMTALRKLLDQASMT